MIATLADQIDWDRFPGTYGWGGSIPTLTEQGCRACGDPIEPGQTAHVYGHTYDAGAPVVLMCDTCHDHHARGGRS
jgi:hypothetical protein